MTVVDESSLGRRLADELSADQCLRSPAWRAAVEAVPRHVFVPAFFRRHDTPKQTMWEPVIPDRVGARAWLDLVYRNETLVTQLDRGFVPADVAEPVPGDPTSSSTLPSLVVRMLEDLEVADGHQVLEIGTGAGYATALLCHRLGDGQVTSVEVDPNVAATAARALKQAGYAPTLVVGDGLAGYPAGAPYDRIVATCSVRRLPAAWLEQTRPGGLILATISGWLFGFGLARLTMAGDGGAQGRFLPGTVSFMIARPQAPPVLGPKWPFIDMSDVRSERAAVLGPDVLDDWHSRFFAQLAAPGAQRFDVSVDGGPVITHLIDAGQRAFASLVPQEDGGYLVRQGGPVMLWDAVEGAVTAWRAAGSPGVGQFSIRVTEESQTVWLDGDERLSFNQP